MPLYEYEREDGTLFEMVLPVAHRDLKTCPTTGQACRKVVSQIRTSREWHGAESQSLQWGLPTKSAQRKARESGEDIEFDERTGAAIFKDDRHHRRFLKHKKDEQRRDNEKAAEAEDKAIRAGVIEKPRNKDDGKSTKKAVEAVQRVMSRK